jgi:hypothetical protein
LWRKALHQVCYQAFGQALITRGRSRSERRVNVAPWAGFAVLCGYAALALALAIFLLRRRDA